MGLGHFVAWVPPRQHHKIGDVVGRRGPHRLVIEVHQFTAHARQPVRGGEAGAPAERSRRGGTAPAPVKARTGMERGRDTRAASRESRHVGREIRVRGHRQPPAPPAPPGRCHPTEHIGHCGTRIRIDGTHKGSSKNRGEQTTSSTPAAGSVCGGRRSPLSLGSSARRTPFCVKGVVTTYELGDLAANVRVESRWLVSKVIEQVIRADAYNGYGGVFERA